jgi:hypothetical protein
VVDGVKIRIMNSCMRQLFHCLSPASSRLPRPRNRPQHPNNNLPTTQWCIPVSNSICAFKRKVCYLGSIVHFPSMSILTNLSCQFISSSKSHSMYRTLLVSSKFNKDEKVRINLLTCMTIILTHILHSLGQISLELPPPASPWVDAVQQDFCTHN